MDITEFIASNRERSLLLGDYDSYRAQSSRRLHTLRRRLGQATPKGRKFVTKPAVTGDDVSRNLEHAQLLLVQAERAWASAMAMKSTHTADSANQPLTGSTKRQVISRLRKATIYADTLVQVLKELSSRDSHRAQVLEAQAYSSMLSGNLLFEKAKWRACIRCFSASRVIYAVLTNYPKNDTFKELLSSTIDPSLRYAAYQCDLPRTKAVSELAVETISEEDCQLKSEIESVDPNAFQTMNKKEHRQEKDAAESEPTPSSIAWRSRIVKIEDASIAQILAVALAKEQRLITQYQDQSPEMDQTLLINLYEEVITARQESVDVTKTAIEELAAEGVEVGDPRVQSLQITKTAVSFALIEWQVGRNRVLCGPGDGVVSEFHSGKQVRSRKGSTEAQKQKVESSGKRLSRLRQLLLQYDSSLQSLENVKALPGIAGDKVFVTDLDSARNYYQALKCLAIGQSRNLLGDSAMALALFHYGLAIARKSGRPSTTDQEAMENDPPRLFVSLKQAAFLQSYIESLETQTRALIELRRFTDFEISDEKDSTDHAPPLIENLNRYPPSLHLGNLVSYPPKIEPIPVKPLFFDLAWNYIDYAGRNSYAPNGVLSSRVGVEDQEKQETRRGWFGFGR